METRTSIGCSYKWRLVANVLRLHHEDFIVKLKAVRSKKRIIFKAESRRQP